MRIPLESFLAEVKIFIFRPKTMDYIVHGLIFWSPEKVLRKWFHLKEHLKRSRTIQISASYHLPVRSYERLKSTAVTTFTKHDCTFEWEATIGTHNSSLEASRSYEAEICAFCYIYTITLVWFCHLCPCCLDDMNTVRVTNLSEDAQEADLRDLFSHFGMIKRIFLAKDKITQHSKVRALALSDP